MAGGDNSSSRPSHRQLPALQTSTPPPPTPQPLPQPQSQPQRHGALPAPAASHHRAQTPPLHITVRFSTSVPDVQLDIAHPASTTIAALKYEIRSSHLTEPTSQRRLRFIHGGRILPDTAIVSSVLKPLPPPPTASDPKGKGKAVEGTAPTQRVYVNCSIGDLLTDTELADEKRQAEEPVPEEAAPSDGRGGTVGGGAAAAGGARPHDRGPRGFDRLLEGGFTPAEVNQLRLQHRARVEARYTADTLPSPDSLRRMEDVWLDSNHTPEAGPSGGAVGEDESGLAAVLDVALKGMLIGFVWPLGAVGWLVRGEEKLPQRMRVMVWFGFSLSLLMGIIRYMG